VVDIITNLNISGVRRMFTAISAETQRRQKLNADTETKDIVEYRKKGFHLRRPDGSPGIPYPHLFIIIDEYAEMIANNPEFKDELDSIARVGRAQGMNLLLAAQRPTGVTDQMRANIKYRICLRVEETDTSREMLRRSDAAFLPNGMPGRGYLQVGNDNIELIQVAWTGDDYTDPPYEEIREGARQPKFFDVVVDTAIELTQGKRPETPWPPPLPNGWLLADPLSISYWGEEQRRQVTLGKRPIDSLNPWVADWLAGRGAWPGLDWSSSALRAVCGLVDDPGNARQLPLLVDLSKGHLVLFGSSGNGKTTFLRTLVASLAATHRPTEFHAHLLDLGGRNLELLEALPHVGSIIMPDERGYEERVQQLLRELGNVVDIRKRLFSAAACTTIFEYNHGNPEKTEPAILVAIDNFSEFLETFGNPAGKDDGNSVFGQFIALARQGKAYGIHFAVTAPRLNALPTPIYSLFTERLTLRLAEQDDYRAIVGAVQSIDEIPGRGYVRVGRDPLEFQIAIAAGDRDEAGQIISEARQIRALGAAMQTAAESLAGGRRPFRIAALPSTSSFREVLTEVLDVTPGDGFVGGLADAIARTWAVTRSAEKADWLEFPLGVTSGNTIRNVHLSAKTDGVHGLIAGGTGSGKSELLMTMIVGLATRYDPTILNFVLVDYKGGGAFKPFEQLPHVVDVVTNLNKAAVYRMFSSISAEIRRRQKLNVDTATKDIVDYRKKGLHLIGEPYPHLVIIIDEYAEMIDDNPEFKSELESITRVGRAQGINLFLASQRPKGVTDQMRANIKLRICLRVEELDTSREMLRRPDAALLPNGMPGRGYLQVGNETIELIQVSYTGERQRDDRSSAILWPERPAPIIDQAASEAPALFEMVVQLTRELTHGKKTLHPWPSFMAPVFSLQSELEDVKLDRRFTLNSAMTEWANGETEGLWPGVAWQSTALRAVVGLVDNPSQASQLPLAFELSRYHLVAYGDSASGKTGLLQTLLLSLAATHSPEELHIYVLDLAGRNFRVHEQLPHMGAVIYADDELFEERLVRLLEKLGRTIEERQRLLAEQGVAGALEYNERNPTQPLPLLLVLIDNFAELIENHEMLVDNTLIPLIRRALPVGISFVTTNGGSSGMVSRVAALFSERITFRQSNTDRYMDIVGRGAVDFGATPGRGYLRMEQKPLLFHIARPIGLYLTESPLDTFVETAELRRVVEAMRTAAQARNLRRPAPIEILADEAPLDALLAEAPAPRLTAIEAVIGRDVRLQPAVVNLRRMGPHFAVAGPPFSGKSTVLYNWVLSLAWRYSPAQVAFLLIDTQRRLVDYGGQHRLSDLPHVWHALQEVDQLAQILPQLQAECAKMAEAPGRPELFIVIDNYDDFGDELDANRVLAGQMAHLARRYGRDGLHFIIAGSLEGAGNDLRRRVQSSNFGLGLRTGNSLDALRVNKRPAGLQDKEMVVGRGYLVKSGQTTLLQSASPWGQNGQGGEGEEESRNAAALDGWVERIVARWPGQFSALQTTASSEAAAGPGSGPVESGLDQQSAEYLEILRRAQAKQDGAGQALVAHWGPREILFSLVKEAVQRELAHDTSGMAASLQTEEDFLLQTEWLFPALENPADTTGTPSTNGDA
jgi:DNA segregation ATPase FtsK/SpoIIIE-like protein